MVSINTIITDVVNKLTTDITTLKVEHFPENREEYRLIHPKGAVLVSYNGSTYSNPSNRQFIQQTRDIEIGVTLVIRGLYNKDGAYSHIDNIITSLTGFAPTDCTKLHPINDNFLSEAHGEWEYGFNFSTETTNYDT